jgi:hypothetical protein
MKKFLQFFFIAALSLLMNISVIAQPTNLTVLDDFTDGNFTANPEWTVVSGPWKIEQSTNQVRTDTKSTDGSPFYAAISTPFTKVCDAWEIFLDPDGATEDQAMEYYFLMINNSNNDPRNASGYKLSYKLQVLQGSSKRNILYLQKVTNGADDGSPLITYDYGTFTDIGKVSLTWDNGNWELFVGTTRRGTASDNSYSPTACTHQALAVIDTTPSVTFSYRHGFDNIKYREATSTSIRGEGNAVSGFMLKAYPNPATDLMQINFNSKKTDRGEIRLLDMQGRMLYSKSISMNAGDNRYDLPLKEQGIRSGTYIIKLQAGTKEEQLKVVVQ